MTEGTCIPTYSFTCSLPRLPVIVIALPFVRESKLKSKSCNFVANDYTILNGKTFWLFVWWEKAPQNAKHFKRMGDQGAFPPSSVYSVLYGGNRCLMFDVAF